MSKNNPVIEYAKKCKILDKEIETVTPAIYASIAIAMNAQGFDNETISNIFGHSQEIWGFHQEHHTIDEMIQQCEDLTDIILRTRPN